VRQRGLCRSTPRKESGNRERAKFKSEGEDLDLASEEGARGPMKMASVWLCGGLDPSGGAGLLRDAATFEHLFGAAQPHLSPSYLATVMTVQGLGAPARSYSLGLAKMQALCRALPAPDVVKIGLVDAASSEALSTVLATRSQAVVVVDPVTVASDGGTLAHINATTHALWQRADLLTPNWGEACAMAGMKHASDAQEIAAGLRGRYPRASVLIKGGHRGAATDQRVVDWLVGPHGLTVFERPRVLGADPRGTGCALATAIAGFVASGFALGQAVEQAITWLDVARSRVSRGRDQRWHLNYVGPPA
jgi:hydroxymethylpyrimidine kinase/phosphomethylpyrimidine kinase